MMTKESSLEISSMAIDLFVNVVYHVVNILHKYSGLRGNNFYD